MNPIRFLSTAAAASLLLAAACTDSVPTSSDPGLIPVETETFEVLLPFEEFGTGFRVDRGFGIPGNLATLVLASGWEGELEVRPLALFRNFPTTASFIPPGDSVAQADSAYVAVGAELILRLDTLRVDGPTPVRVRVSALAEEWDRSSVSWTHAVDSVGERRPWSTPGGGELRPLSSAEWSPADGDSLVLVLDSAAVEGWREENASGAGLLLSSETEGSRIRVREMTLRLRAASEINPDTVVRVTAGSRESSFIYIPEPDFPGGVVAVGGAPAHRTAFRVTLPSSVTATGPICRGNPSCPVELLAERVVFAGLGFTSLPTDPPGLAPADSLTVDLRPVLAPDRLPKSPLGPPLRLQGTRIGPGLFAQDGGGFLEIAMTRFIRNVLRGEDEQGEPVTGHLAFMASVEPSGLGVATFAGPGTEGRPVLRLILTVSEGVSLP